MLFPFPFPFPFSFSFIHFFISPTVEAISQKDIQVKYVLSTWYGDC